MPSPIKSERPLPTADVIRCRGPQANIRWRENQNWRFPLGLLEWKRERKNCRARGVYDTLQLTESTKKGS